MELKTKSKRNDDIITIKLSYKNIYFILYNIITIKFSYINYIKILIAIEFYVDNYSQQQQ
jgi:hypothetical protein